MGNLPQNNVGSFTFIPASGIIIIEFTMAHQIESVNDLPSI